MSSNICFTDYFNDNYVFNFGSLFGAGKVTWKGHHNNWVGGSSCWGEIFMYFNMLKTRKWQVLKILELLLHHLSECESVLWISRNRLQIPLWGKWAKKMKFYSIVPSVNFPIKLVNFFKLRSQILFNMPVALLTWFFSLQWAF